jgi:hypothetical protein
MNPDKAPLCPNIAFFRSLSDHSANTDRFSL